MVRAAHGVRVVPGGIRSAVVGAVLLLWAGTAGAQGADSAGTPPAARAQGLDLSLDVSRLLPRSVSAPAAAPRSRLRLSPAASLPDPRSLKGAGSRDEAAMLRLNLKGFSVLEARDGEGAELRVRRIRERELRRPALSVTLQKRF